MPRTIGTRVFAAQKADDSTVYLYGHGVYEGDFEPPIPPLGGTWDEFDEMGRGILGDDYQRPTNPRILLDSGEYVWGMQCWWGNDSRFDEFVNGRQIVEVPVENLLE